MIQFTDFKPAKFEALTRPVVGAAIHIKLEGQDHPWSIKIPIDQALDFESAGAPVHWLQPSTLNPL